MAAPSSITCPACGQSIINPSSLTGKTRCAGCATEFPLAGADAPITAPDAPPQLKPLGKEPSAGTYGLLFMFAYALVALRVILGVLELYALFASPEPAVARTSSAAASMRQSPVFPVIKTLISITLDVVWAGLAVLTVSKLEMLDRLSTWLAWRSGARTEAVSEPPGSSLPYILPWTVCGGLLVVGGIVALTAGPGGAAAGMPTVSLASRYGSMALLGSGVMLFLMGLTCGELRRFFWRMQQLARSLPRRTRGEELGIEAALAPKVKRAVTSSPVFVLIALPVLLLLYGLFIATMTSTGATFSALIEKNWAIALAVLIGIVGGAFSIFRLTSLFSETLSAWEAAAETVKTTKRKSFGASSTRVLTIVNWVVGALFTAAQVTMFLTMRLGFPGEAKVMVFCSGVVISLFLGWLASLKIDCMRLVKATSAFGRGTASSSSLLITAKALKIRCAVSLVWTIVLLVVAYLEIASMASSSPFMKDYFLMMILASIQTLLGLLAITLLPAYWFSLVALDVNQACANLQQIQDNSPA